MNLSQFYKLAIKLGSQRDPRKLKNIASYADTAILHGDPDKQINRILVGIDIEVAELLLADRIRAERGLDLVISHHPEGRAYAMLFEVMQLQVSLLISSGIEKCVAQQFLEERKREVERRILPQNHTRPVDAARILDLAFMCIHTPADNHVYSFVRELLDKEKPAKVKDIVRLLKDIPEYKNASDNLCGPRVILGNPNRDAGKILVEMTGGTEGPRNVFDKLYKAGVRTLVSMHLSEEHFKKVKDANLNVVIAGHISSDNLGLNLLLDRLEQIAKKKFVTIDCSGFKRIRRI